MIGRRGAMIWTGGGLAQLLIGHAGAQEMSADLSVQPLRAHAARKGLSFGLCVVDEQVRRGGRAMALVAGQADCLVAGNALKWGNTEYVLGWPDYRAAERAVRFAEKHRLRMRGHTAFWYRNLPAKISRSLDAPETPALFLKHVNDVVGRFRGRIWEWDVVNEAIEPHDKMAGLLRRLPFASMDYGYLADLFAAAHEADPAARLYYNDYMLEGMLDYEVEKRRAVLTLIEQLRKRNAPLHGLGIQSHMATHLPFDAKVFRTFLADVAAMGLDIRLTEFDVSDRKAGGTIAERDRQVADLGRRFLDAAFDERAVKGLLCWGIDDRESFYNNPYATAKRIDGLPQRPLPFDDKFRRKPLWFAIAKAFDGAPDR